MKVAVMVGPRELEIREVPDSVGPDDGLLLGVEACGVCGSDLRRWREGPPPGAGPVVPGHEVAGVVLEVGGSVVGYSPGDRLAIAPDVHCGHCYYCERGRYNLCDSIRMIGITPGYPGGFAEKMVVTRETLANGIVHAMPDGMSFIEGALAEPCSSVLAAHESAGTSVGDTVFVIGAGPIGCLHVAISKARGASVIVSQRSQKRRELVKLLRPHAVIDPSTEDVVTRVRQLTGGRGADIAICANGVSATQALAVECVRKGGRVVLFGGLPRSSPMTSLDANRIHYGEIVVVGAFSYHPTFHELALDFISRQLAPADLLVTHTFPLERVGDAFEAAASGTGLKVMVCP
jgi:L-iditol 2-dehydrogenase